MNNIMNENMYYREKCSYYIYIHTCPNHITYVGMSQRPEQRWNNGEGYKDNKNFYNAIRKYGWDNIKHEIVAETNYKWIAQKIERTLITEFKKKKKSFNENNIELELLKKKSIRKVPLKKVAQYDENNNLIKIYESARDAGMSLGISPEYIRNCCAGRIKKQYKYIWKYI